jgi:hypothetical protein
MTKCCGRRHGPRIDFLLVRQCIIIQRIIGYMLLGDSAFPVVKISNWTSCPH